MVTLGGIVPPQDYEEMRSAGVVAIFGPGTPITVKPPARILNLLEGEPRSAKCHEGNSSSSWNEDVLPLNSAVDKNGLMHNIRRGKLTARERLTVFVRR